MTSRPAQIPLGLRWPAHQRLDEFLGSGNAIAVASVRACVVGDGAAPRSVFVAGPHASGKTHLLIGACAAATAQGRRAQYVPLRSIAATAGEALAEVSGECLYAIDDVDAAAGRPEAERALFAFHNRARAAGAAMLFAAVGSPAHAGFALPDLVSRLAAATQARLEPLDEAGRREALCRLARSRGLELTGDALDWLFAHRNRDLAALVADIGHIDQAALAEQRRVTVPFLRGVFAGNC